MSKMPPDFSNLTVVVADDDEIVRGLLRTLLRLAGFQVVAEASNAERTLDAYNKYHPSIVCLDIDMPDASGLEVLTRIRAMSTDTIIIIISAATTQENTHRALAEKADGILAKPFNTARVVGEIERILERRRPSQVAAVSSPSAHQPSFTAGGGADEPQG